MALESGQALESGHMGPPGSPGHESVAFGGQGNTNGLDRITKMPNVDGANGPGVDGADGADGADGPGVDGADVKGKGKDLDYVVAEDGRANATENAVAPGAREATKQEQEAPTHTHVKESKPAAKAEITVAADKSKEEVNEESKDDIKVAKDEAEAAIAEVIF